MKSPERVARRVQTIQPSASDDVRKPGTSTIQIAESLPSMREDVTIVLPALNEEEAIGFVLTELKGLRYHNILVVDGHSSDHTVDIARSLGVLVIIQPKRGKADAVKEAVNRVRTPLMLVMDADGTYDPTYIGDMLLYSGQSDEVIGCRAVGRENIPKLHRFGNLVITKVFNVLFGTRLRDVCSGMYLLNTRVAREMEFETEGFCGEVEVAAHVAATSRKLRDINIGYRPRIGKPKLGKFAGLRIMRAVLGLTLRYNPAFLIFGIGAALWVPSLVVLGWVAYQFLFLGNAHFVWAVLGCVGAGIAIVSSLLAIMALYMKRMEYRVLDKLRVYNG